MTQGRFISIEGGEGVGKSTQITALSAYLRTLGKEVVVTREPGGTQGAEAIRELLLSGSDNRWNPRAEALLFAAARSDHIESLICPALAAGKWVISDRFIESSRAYQGIGLGLGDEAVMALHTFGSRGFLPDRTILLALPNGEGIHRAAARDGSITDRIGGRSLDFHRDVESAFIRFAEQDPARIRRVDARGSVEQVAARIIAEVEDLLK